MVERAHFSLPRPRLAGRPARWWGALTAGVGLLLVLRPDGSWRLLAWGAAAVLLGGCARLLHGRRPRRLRYGSAALLLFAGLTLLLLPPERGAGWGTGGLALAAGGELILSALFRHGARDERWLLLPAGAIALTAAAELLTAPGFSLVVNGRRFGIFFLALGVFNWGRGWEIREKP